jgi:hypothetical protein
MMLATTITGPDAENPLAGLHVGEHPDPIVEQGWSLVEVRAASINHHDVWSLRGIAPKNAPYPRVLGSDGAGVDEAGREVIVHAMINDPAWEGDEILDPRVTMLGTTTTARSPSASPSQRGTSSRSPRRSRLSTPRVYRPLG